jgi:hypothetical protein
MQAFLLSAVIALAAVSPLLAQNMIPASGNVGIGTTTPHAPLEIHSGFDTEVLRFGYSDELYHFISTSFHGDTPSNNYLGFHVASTPKNIPRVFTMLGNGNVGIGTSAPEENLSVNHGLNINQAEDNDGTLIHGLKFGGSGSGEGVASRRTEGEMKWGLELFTNHLPRISILNDGKIGIGTRTPSRALQIEGTGDVELGLRSIGRTARTGRLWTLQASGNAVPELAGTFQIIDRSANVARLLIFPDGIVSVGVLKITGGSDLAEPFAVSTGDLPSGSVVSIDPDHPGQLMRSGQEYDTRVAGIVSGANGIQPGLILRTDGMLDRGQNVALSGRVYALADASKGPIRPGDLLTTSDLPGYCMAVQDRARAQGAILGKAMTGLESGQGMVLVLVSLQ